MTRNNWILTYYQKVKNGSIVVGRWTELLLTYLVKGLEENAFFSLILRNKPHFLGYMGTFRVKLWQTVPDTATHRNHPV